MKRNPQKTDAEKKYKRQILWRKLRLYAVLLLASVLVLILSVALLDKNYTTRLKPQINRAVIQVAKLLPQLEQNEDALREAYARGGLYAAG